MSRPELPEGLPEGLPDDLQRVLEMAYNLYHRRLAKEPERLREVSAALAPYGVALSDFKKFRLGYSAAEGDTLSGYYREELAQYPAITERFERLGLLRGGRDALAGCVTCPVLGERGKPEGIIGVPLGVPLGIPYAGGRVDPSRQLLPPGQDPSAWLFGLERAAYGLADHGVAIVACGVLSFFTLYSILAAIGLDVACALAAPRLEAAGLARLINLGAEEVYVLADVAADLDPGRAALHRLPPALSAEEALVRLEAIAGETSMSNVGWMLRQAVAATRDLSAKRRRQEEQDGGLKQE